MWPVQGHQELSCRAEMNCQCRLELYLLPQSIVAPSADCTPGHVSAPPLQALSQNRALALSPGPASLLPPSSSLVRQQWAKCRAPWVRKSTWPEGRASSGRPAVQPLWCLLKETLKYIPRKGSNKWYPFKWLFFNHLFILYLLEREAGRGGGERLVFF